MILLKKIVLIIGYFSFINVCFFTTNISASITDNTFNYVKIDNYKGYNKSIRKWKKPTAKVFIDSSSSQLTPYIVTAIKDWNSTNVFKFILINDPTNADIIIYKNFDPGAKTSGLTYSNVDNQSGYFIPTQDIYLNDYFFEKYNTLQKVHTIAHELGHAIGLNHNESDKNSLMYPITTEKLIQPNDIKALRAIYNTPK
ncbi:matrixin family metalloprotease [Lactobacillus reuteri]|nr:matrixin family metalloprotease [Limosilactobacillus reuteri]